MMCKGKEKREIPDKFVLNFPLCGGRVRELLLLKPGCSGKLTEPPPQYPGLSCPSVIPL